MFLPIPDTVLANVTSLYLYMWAPPQAMFTGFIFFQTSLPFEGS